MPNNNIVVCHEIENVTPAEKTWLKLVLDEEIQCPDMAELIDEAEYYPSFDYRWTNNGVIIEGDSVLLHHVAYLFRLLLAKFRPEDYIIMKWAKTCSKMVPGEWGGGWAFITAKHIKYDWSYRTELIRQFCS